MSDFLKLLFDWPGLLQAAGFDAVIYAALALVGTALFAIRLAMSLIGLDHDVDVDMAADVDAHGGGFGVFSILSITAFLMGTGWLGLIARLEWRLSPTVAAIVATMSGVALMMLASSMMLFMRRAAHHVEYNPRQAVGHTGTVYMNIPEAGQGNGQVRVNVQGRSVIVNAVSTGPAIASFSDVRIIAARDEKTLVVEPA